MSKKKILFLSLSLIFIFGFLFAKETFAQNRNSNGTNTQVGTLKYYKGSTNDTYREATRRETQQNSTGASNTSFKTTYEKRDASTGTWKTISAAEFNASGRKTTLPLDPEVANSSPSNPVQYDYNRGLYYRTASPSTTYDPYTDRALLSGLSSDLTSYSTGTENAVTKATGVAPSKPPEPDPNKINLGCNNFDLICWIAEFSHNVIFLGSGWITGVIGFLFDKVIDYTITEMGDNINEKNSPWVGNVWTILRDIVNIAFIFVLIYIGIMTIIKGFESGTQKLIGTVIVVALLLNFSLFFTKIIIDASNIIAVNFYQAMETSRTNSSKDNWQGIAATFIQELSLANFTQHAKDATRTGDKQNIKINVIRISLAGTIIMLVLAVVLLFATFMFMTRYIFLIILLVTSSAAIGSWILPSLKKQVFDKWWSALIGQAFMAPVFMLFLYISLIVSTAVTKSLIKEANANRGWADLILNPQGTIDTTINFAIAYIIVIGFLIGTLIVSKNLSNRAGEYSGKMTAMLGGAAFGAGAFAGRRLGGGIGNRMANSETFKNMTKATGLTGPLARMMGKGGLLLGDKMRKGTWDGRSALGVSKILKTSGVNVGEASTTTFENRVDAAKKRIEERRKLYGDKPVKPEDVLESDADYQAVRDDDSPENQRRRAEFKKAEDDLRDEEAKITTETEEIARLEAKMAVAVQAKREDEAADFAVQITKAKARLQEHREAAENRSKTIQAIKNFYKAQVAARRSPYLIEKSSAFSQFRRTAANRIIEEQSRTKTDFDKLLQELKNQQAEAAKKTTTP